MLVLVFLVDADWIPIKSSFRSQFDKKLHINTDVFSYETMIWKVISLPLQCALVSFRFSVYCFPTFNTDAAKVLLLHPAPLRKLG